MRSSKYMKYIPANARNILVPEKEKPYFAFWQEGKIDHYCVAISAPGEETCTGYSYTLKAPETGECWALIETGKNGQHIGWLWREA